MLKFWLKNTLNNMYEKNPLSPHLQIYKWGITMALSISHRIIGVVNFISILFISLIVIYLQFGAENYQIINLLLNSLFGKVLIIFLCWSFSFHVLNELRHLLWDIGFGYDLKTSRITGVITIVGSFVLAIVIFLIGKNFI